MGGRAGLSGRGAVVGVDLGGTNVAGVLVDADGARVQHVRNEHHVVDAPSAVEAVAEAVETARVGEPVIAVGVAVAGWLSADRTLVRGALNLGLIDVPLPALLADVLDVAVTMHNDGDAAAYAEHQACASRPRCLLEIVVGTGLGAGMVVDGRVLTGGHGLAGELGHVQVRQDGRPCACGGTGCAELYASGGGVAARARERPGAAPVCGSQEVVAEARAGDDESLALLVEAGRTLGELIATLLPVLDPDVVVVGGGFGTAAADLLLPPAAAELRRRASMLAVTEPPHLLASTLGPYAAAVGAAALARQNLEETR